MIHTELMKTRQPLYNKQNTKGSANLNESNHRLKHPENTLNIALLLLAATTSSYCWHWDRIIPFDRVSRDNRSTVMLKPEHSQFKLDLFSCFTFQGCRDGVPDERGGAALPSPRQEAVRGGLPVGGHPGAAVGTGVWAGVAGAGGVWWSNSFRGPHSQGLYLQHAWYVYKHKTLDYNNTLYHRSSHQIIINHKSIVKTADPGFVKPCESCCCKLSLGVIWLVMMLLLRCLVQKRL